ncbi:MAG: NAD(P)/FAD-dependent oxidoreductase [Candidatus Eremiobacteraeota bacterium]|nr:NAD(P)/FAD-dependent oxidoreductase [Candidatus Eremiobacteraeota bacterium]
MKRIVILGGGFAGIAVAQRLEHRLNPDEAELVLISRENFSLFTPMLPEVASGALDVRQVATPIRSQLRRTRFILAEFTALDTLSRAVSFTHVLSGESERLEYDQLVLGLGSSISTFGLPGVEEHAFPLKTLEDAGTLRNRLMWLLERADASDDAAVRERLLTVVVVGGGFTGVETAGEMSDLLHRVARFYPNVAAGDARIVLVEGGATLLPGLPAKMGEYATRALVRRGVEVRTGVPVTAASEDALDLADGSRIPTATIVWSAGVKPSPAIAAAQIPHGKGGAVVTAPDMSVPGFAGLWALGDAAAIPNGSGGFYPPTAQHAIREGPVVADNVVATLRDLPTSPFRFTSLGMMASLGGRRAVAQLPGDRVLTGFAAWFLWRGYYLARLPGLDRKLRVAFEWALDLLFPRDIAVLRVYLDGLRAEP